MSMYDPCICPRVPASLPPSLSSCFSGWHLSLTPPKSLGHVFGGALQGPLEILIQPELTAATALWFGPAIPIPQREAAVPPRLV